MRYEGTVYRPPSEAYSLIIQVTIGCAHNRCTFCNMYREKQFRIRSKEEIMRDLDECRRYYGPNVRRIFPAELKGWVQKGLPRLASTACFLETNDFFTIPCHCFLHML